jgi:hypothetical protein
MYKFSLKKIFIFFFSGTNLQSIPAKSCTTGIHHSIRKQAEGRTKSMERVGWQG